MSFKHHVQVNQNQIGFKGVNLPSDHGAHSQFMGVVRDHNHGKKVLKVEYDAFIPLAEKELKDICHEAEKKWGPLNVYVHHRLGELFVGDASVIISVSSPHRNEAFEASRYVIEELKKRVPIWKKETYEDGESEWLKGHALCQHR